MGYTLRTLTPEDLSLMDGLLTMFGEAFGDTDTYGKKRPSAAYMKRLLGSDTFIALVALQGEEVVGGIAAYELKKFEQERSEIYIYDLAVAEGHRRQGIALSLIEKLQEIGRDRGAYVIFVQADTDPDDAPAIALYSKVGELENVLHFDIPVAAK
jgi:aminoglycoside 3-N-acetyltransferase I